MNRLSISFLLLTAIAFASYSEDYAQFQTAELQCLIGNNASLGEHRSGYNGVFKLTSIHQSETLFVPSYAGLNLEHYFDGSTRTKDRDVFFEPRRAPMSFHKLNDRTVELRQPSVPVWQVESTTRFQLTDPYYVDVTIRCIPHKEHFQGGALGLFWASYINSPLNKSTYFLRKNGDSNVWQQFCTQYHGHDSTIKYADDKFEWPFDPDAPTSLFTKISPVRYSEPFFYGRFKNMVFIVMFASPDGIRFAHSPSGSGTNTAKDDTCPAWDFQWIIPSPKAGQEYEMKYRVAYKQWTNREDVLEEMKKYRQISGQ